VDDGSTDATPDLINRVASERPQGFSTHHLPRNMGKAEAVRQGMLKAHDMKPQYAGFLDADLAAPLEEIQRLLEILQTRQDVLMVLGSRIRMLGTTIQRSPTRHYLGRVAATLISGVLNLGVYDTQCGAKFLRCSEFSRSIFQEPFECKWLFDVEIIARGLQLLKLENVSNIGNLFVEVPLRNWSEEGGSSITAKSYIRSLLDLARTWRRYRRPR